MKLKDSVIKHAQPREKQYRLTDGGGLYILIHQNGGKYWRLDYRHNSTRKTLAIGVYPEVTLAEARKAREDAKELLRQGIDPSQHKQETQKAKTGSTADNSLRALANEWLDIKKPEWSDKHIIKITGLLNNHILPALGNKPIDDISGKEALDLAKLKESEGYKSIQNLLLQTLAQVARYGIATQRANNNPFVGLSSYLQSQIEEHHRHISVNQLESLLKAIDGYTGSPITIMACKLTMLVFLRSNELRHGRWEHIDWKNKTWTVPSEQMKGRKIAKESGMLTHVVPLADQTIKILKELHLLTGKGVNMFPSQRGEGKVISDGTINKMLKTIGFHDAQTTHGFRGLVSTVLNESQLFNQDIIERQLAHKKRNKVRRAYNHAEYLEERRKLMQYWADYLTEHGLKTKILNGNN
ncbi:MAG: integrase arm-type DNA-binding domain-containing protein [Alcaligenaceae bacterium]|nr:integrase arm-type DNA-binding domain-containing protein [Alcaligenaceae bacterium]